MMATGEETRAASGSFKSSDPLVGFLYVLMRDDIPAGVVGSTVRDSLNAGPSDYTNGWLGRYAEYLAGQLRGGDAADGDDPK